MIPRLLISLCFSVLVNIYVIFSTLLIKDNSIRQHDIYFKLTKFKSNIFQLHPSFPSFYFSHLFISFFICPRYRELQKSKKNKLYAKFRIRGIKTRSKLLSPSFPTLRSTEYLILRYIPSALSLSSYSPPMYSPFI